MVQTKSSMEIGEPDGSGLNVAVFVPQLPEYKDSTEFLIYGEAEIPIELEMLVKYG